MPKINIADLSKEKVILALFKNVYGKSVEARNLKREMLKFTPNEPGIYSEPYDFEISKILRQNSKINSIGCVKFHMDFTGTIIDSDLYDQLHQAGTNGVEFAADVVEKLRLASESRSEFKFSFSNEGSSILPSISRPVSSHYSSIEIKLKQDKQSIKIIQEKLSSILLHDCELLTSLYGHELILGRDRAQDELEKYAEKLKKLNLNVKITEPTSLAGELVKISAKLHLTESLDIILDKCKRLSSEPESKNIEQQAILQNLSMFRAQLEVKATDAELKSLSEIIASDAFKKFITSYKC